MQNVLLLKGPVTAATTSHLKCVWHGPYSLTITRQNQAFYNKGIHAFIVSEQPFNVCQVIPPKDRARREQNKDSKSGFSFQVHSFSILDQKYASMAVDKSAPLSKEPPLKICPPLPSFIIWTRKPKDQEMTHRFVVSVMFPGALEKLNLPFKDAIE